jgi:hypothetical protein
LEENLNQAGLTCQRPISFLPPRPGNRTRAARHGAVHQVMTALIALMPPNRPLSVTARLPMWRSLIPHAWASPEEPLSIFASPHDHIVPSFALLISPSAAARLIVERHHHPPPLLSEWRIRSAIVPSSCCTWLQPKWLASDAGSHRSLHHHILPCGSPSSTMLYPPSGHSRTPQAPPSSPATL